MQVINKTVYDTKSLKSLVSAVYRKVSKAEGALPYYKNLQITFMHCRKTGLYFCPGEAWHDAPTEPRINMRFPTYKGRRKRGAEVREAAIILEHELLHLYGLEHDDMGYIGLGNGWDYDDTEIVKPEYDSIVKLFRTEFIPLAKEYLEHGHPQKT